MSDDPQDMAAEADDYVLGLMEPVEQDAFETRLERDASLARAVGQARDRLLPFDLSATEAPIPPGFVARVRAAIATVPASQSHPLAANTAVAARRRWGVAAAAACAGLLVGGALGLLRPVPDPMVIAVLLNDQGVPQALIEDYGNDTAQVRFLADITLPADRTMQVWTLPSAEMGPVSLGVVSEVAATRLNGPALPPPAGQQLYEITLEPLGGSPTGRPTGPILGKGLAALQDG